MIRAGYHVSKSKNLLGNIQTLTQIGGKAVQFYNSPKQGLHPGIPIPEKDVEAILKIKADYNLYIVVHGKLILNFARPQSSSNKWQRDALIRDLQQANRVGADVIIHQGKNVKEIDQPREEALNNFVDNLQTVLEETNNLENKILLENSCQQGTEVGYAVEELKIIYNKFTEEEKQRIGFCLDLCHIFVAGQLNVSDPEAVRNFFEEFETEIGLDKLEVIHFNDSKIKLNGHNDNHADLLVGFIGNSKLGGDPAGFLEVIKIAQEKNIPMILETPGVIPYLDQLHLILNFEKEVDLYVTNYIDIIDNFTNNPISSKGARKKKNQPKPTTPKTKIAVKIIKK